MATIYDVAREAGVSITTVSHVLNGTRFVSAETRSRVEEVIEHLNYVPNSLARALVRQETRTVALIVPDNVNPFFAEMARGIEQYGFDAGYTVILCNSDRNSKKERAYLEMLISRRVDGLVYMTTGADPRLLAPLLERNIPIVTFDRDYEAVDAILLDNFQGGYDATSHLVELGHRRIACIAGPDPAGNRSWQRVDGYRQALIDAGIDPDPALIVRGDWTYVGGREAARQLEELPSRPTAIFACNDTMAIGVVAFLHENGRQVPDQISVVGFDNITLSAFVSPPLTTLSTPAGEVGERLCRLLVDRITNPNASPAPRKEVIRGRLLVRSSTRSVE